jgi:Glycosyltransferases involved in cell wall biogenesis
MTVVTPARAPARGSYWVVIPAYNEARTIRDIVVRTLRHVNHVVVVDDGSTDGTAEALDDLPIILLRNPLNCGKAASLWRGFQHALGARACGVITLDGDGQHLPEDIELLLAQAARAPDQLILGARRRDQRRASFSRYCANRFADFWISWAAGYPIADSQSGFRVYPARLLQQVRIKHGKAWSFVFESEILIEGARLNYRAIPVPVDTLSRPRVRPSYFRPVLDVARITGMVACKLLSRGFYLPGLYRSLRDPIRPSE